MAYYNLIIYKIIVFYIPQKNRNIKKTYYKKIGIIENVKNKDLSDTTINMYQKLDTGYIIAIVNKKQRDNTIDPYYEKLNQKSEKQYQELKNNTRLKQVNLDIKKQYFNIKYNDLIQDMDIIKQFIKNID